MLMCNNETSRALLLGIVQRDVIAHREVLLDAADSIFFMGGGDKRSCHQRALPVMDETRHLAVGALHQT